MNTNSHTFDAFPAADLCNPDLEIMSACPKRNRATLDWRWTPGEWATIARAHSFTAHEAAHMYLAGWTMKEVCNYQDWISEPSNSADAAMEGVEGSYISEYDEVNFRHTNWKQRDAWCQGLKTYLRHYKTV